MRPYYEKDNPYYGAVVSEERKQFFQELERLRDEEEKKYFFIENLEIGYCIS